MGKLIRNGIEYGGGNGTDIFEVTQAEYDALVQEGTLVHNALYVITDAPNLNATAQQISYDGGADTVWDKVEGVKATLDGQTDASNPLFKIKNYESSSLTVPANGAVNVTANQMGISVITGYTPIAMAGWYTGSNDTFARSVDITATGGSSFCVLRNVGATAYTGTYQVKIMYVKSAYQKTVT